MVMNEPLEIERLDECDEKRTWTGYPYPSEDLFKLVRSYAESGNPDLHSYITARPDGTFPPSAYGAVMYLSLVYEEDFWVQIMEERW